MNSALQIKPIDKQMVLNFIGSLRIGDSYEYRVSEAADKPTVIASATAALLMNFIDKLDALSTEEKQRWANHLLASIDDNGLVNDPVDYEIPTQNQPQWALRAHRTRHTAWAIEALGFQLEKPVTFLEPYIGKKQIGRWLDEIWSSNWYAGFWRAGNWIMDMCVLLDLQFRHFNDQSAFDTLIELLNLLSRKLEPDTGLWRGDGDDDRNAMAGSMHIYPLYWAYYQPLPFFDKAVELTLNLQRSDGLFGYEVGKGGSQCLDYDASLVLINGYVQFDQFSDRIYDCFKKMRKAIEANRQPSGSWSDCLVDEERSWATAACIYNASHGSIWDTYARIMTVAMCDKVLDSGNSNWFTSEHHLFEIFDAGTSWINGQSSF